MTRYTLTPRTDTTVETKLVLIAEGLATLPPSEVILECLQGFDITSETIEETE